MKMTALLFGAVLAVSVFAHEVTTSSASARKGFRIVPNADHTYQLVPLTRIDLMGRLTTGAVPADGEVKMCNLRLKPEGGVLIDCGDVTFALSGLAMTEDR